jgi:tRNA dimethylallyltransferase
VTHTVSDRISTIAPDRPVLIAGPTASGKSELALRIAEAQGGVVINADAIQVYSDWRVLTARPSAEDEIRAPHALYGHVAGDVPYSVGDWLRDVEPLLSGNKRPIIIGGTGLYFTALTEGLAQIPATPDDIRTTAMQRIASEGHSTLAEELDAKTAARIDLANPMRVQRAWEVLTNTGKGLADWQDATDPPRLRLNEVTALVINAEKHWLTPRIEARFDKMLETGAMEEARANRPTWSPNLPSAKAIGAAELMGVIDGTMPLQAARDRSTILTRQFAKRQRTWFRARMRDWQSVDAREL